VQLGVTTPVGSICYTSTNFRDCAISINGEVIPIDLIQLGIQGYDVILGID